MKNQAKKLQLNDLSVDSFVTELTNSSEFTIKGGSFSELYCDSGLPTCRTNGPECDRPATFEETCTG